MDSKLLKEILGLGDEFDLDEKALDKLKEYGFNFSEGDNMPKMTEAQMQRFKEEMKIKELKQKELLERPLEANLFKAPKLEQDHGLTTLCTINTYGYSEKILRLTEVFLPTKDDEVIRQRMDKYNRDKMPNLKQHLETSVLE